MLQTLPRSEQRATKCPARERSPTVKALCPRETLSHGTTYILFASTRHIWLLFWHKKIYRRKIFALRLFILILEEGLAIMYLCVCRIVSSKLSLRAWEPELPAVQTANTRSGIVPFAWVSG